MSHYNSDDAFKAVSELIDGSVSAEECFCMILSMLGEEQTKLQFHNILQNAGVPLNKSLLTELSSIYSNYFSVSSNEDFLDVNQDEGESFGDELDMELALALSVTETHLSSATASRSQQENQASSEKLSQQSHTSYASKAKSQTSTVPVPKSVKYNGSDYGPRTASDGASSKDPRTVSNTNGFGTVERASTSDISQEKGSKKKKKKKKGVEKQQAFTIPGLARTLSNKPVIYWLRRDLRLHDNPALVAAYESTAPVIVTFLWNETEEGPLAAGGATKYWLHFALSELDKSFQKEYSNRIVFRKVENSQREMMSLVEETGAESVLMNNLYEPCLKVRDDKISAALTSKGVTVKRFDSYLLHTPESVSTDSLGMRGIGSVTHFMECCRQSSTEPIGFPAEKPRCLPASKTAPFSQSLDELGLARLPRRKDGSIIDWAKVIRESWDFSENGAWEALDLFVDGGIRNYEKESGRTDTLNTSRISPYLHFGQISPRTVLRHAQGLRSPKFLRKLAWRDLSYWLLTKFPDMPSKPMRVHYQNQRWSGNKQHLKAWQKGNTGYPLVDAAMRQLWLTGWMNNYARHVVASFLISYLHFHWEHGYKWFQDTLLDADVAINAMMWQNGGMSGLDQWNFVMHPVDAALTCDPQGHYVRKWCPELAGLPDDFIHKPWKCPPSIMRRAGVELGSNYPHRIITDLEEAREQSLKDVVQIRRANPQFVDPYTGNDLVLLPSGLLLPVITRREFKYKTAHPEAKDNPHTAVLRGYRSRKRDEAVAFANKVDFTASTLNECTLRHKRYEQNNYFVDI